MKFKPVFCLMAAALMLAASEARATPFFYDVDSLTLPGGPFTLEHGVITSIGGDLYTLSGTVVNNSPNTFHNVEFLNEFVFDTPADSAATDLPFDTMAGDWSATIGSDLDTLATTMSDPPAGTLEMLPSNTNVPLYSGILDGTSGTLQSTDSVPYFTVGTGTVLGGASTSFSETVEETSGSFPVFDLRGSFISTDPIPEPSTLILVGFGAICLVAFRSRQKRLSV